MRFDSPEHLQTWKQTGAHPRIHDGIAHMIIADMRGKRVLDLGCSYGLLADRISRDAMAEFVLGVDGDADVLTAGREAGVRANLVDLKVNADTLDQLMQVVTDNGITVVVARRILPELFGDDLPLGRRFAQQLAAARVSEVFLEGRVASVKSVNALRSIAEEVMLMSGSFRLVNRVGALAYLAAR